MADKNSKVSESVDGKYYVDHNCISCESCMYTAPDNFRMKKDGSSSMVFKQPSGESEIAACNDAKAGCPVGAIGDDGDV
ncbi:MAG: ferredoxin [Fibrobacterota bacterium]